MSGCTQIGKPLISILMAVYEPNLDWLRIQLKSLNAQTYPNLRLYIRDDCSPTVPFEAIQSCVQDCIAAFPWSFQRNEKNLGSNGTFEQLTQEAEGKLFAYCDQDDEWLADKLSALVSAMTPKTTLAYCDLSAIDGEGNTTAKSLRELRPRLRYVQGKGLSETYFFRNCSAGCTTLVRSETAKRALPFPKNTVCDQWVAMIAALEGKIEFVDRPLLRYRIHGGNQTGVLTGVTDKQSYFNRRIAPLRERLAFYKKYIQPSSALEAFVSARLNGKVLDLIRYRALSPMEAKFELAMHVLPRSLFRWVVRKILK
ncbi:glycosyltransferase [Oscillibacter sp.]|uniref:glycosyltransferase n=1 Tax=Oscillibacter sp. TaxID=1945593 RepID=UPI0026322CA0|nr:glycosyltransferase [Oscillibacter sp.]MDD3346461.1 glycosyltransferase [Oscillibacter sp.]